MVIEVIDRIRRNHALEHATIAMLLEGPGIGVPLAGVSIANGFLLYGNVSTEAVTSAVEEALRRLRAGERELAVSNYCGTNLVVAALLTGLTIAIASRGKKGIAKLPPMVTWAFWSSLASRPLGRLVQKRLTTHPDMRGMAVGDVQRWGKGNWTVHRIKTSFAR